MNKNMQREKWRKRKVYENKMEETQTKKKETVNQNKRPQNKRIQTRRNKVKERLKERIVMRLNICKQRGRIRIGQEKQESVQRNKDER